LSRNSLLDVNVLIALTEPGHTHYQRAQNWFDAVRSGTWGICPLTEVGFIRLTTNPRFIAGARSVAMATAILQTLKGHPDYIYLGNDKGWVELTARFSRRIVGHQQVTDAYLLGLAIDADAVLVTFDRGIREGLAKPEYSQNIFVIE
jgi:uncharacterized protein